MNTHSKCFIPFLLLFVCFLSLIVVSIVLADSSKTETEDSSEKTLSERSKAGFRGPIGWHYYWEDGYLRIDSRKDNIKYEINGKVLGDGGTILADDELQNAFPDLDGSNIIFRKLLVSIYGNFYDTIDFRVGIDFANATDIQDIWIRYLRHPFLKKVKIGNMKEPFSLEYLTSIGRITFMERSLPDQAFGFGRNIGIRYDSSNTGKRINWGAGAFLNTGSFSDLGEAKDRISEANGFDLTARVFGLPVYAEDGNRLLHLGLGYSYGVRNANDFDSPLQLRTRPESRLTDDRLVDTGPVTGIRRDTVNAELAMVMGPWSFQGQCYYASLDANAAGDPSFWGYYAFVSYFLTGEHRKYNPLIGIFTGVDPQPSFAPSTGEWGALEMVFRHSYVDLNDGEILGGQESNFTVGTNWHYNRNVRVMFNYTHAYVTDRESPPIENGRARIFQARLQFLL